MHGQEAAGYDSDRGSGTSEIFEFWSGSPAFPLGTRRSQMSWSPMPKKAQSSTLHLPGSGGEISTMMEMTDGPVTPLPTAESPAPETSANTRELRPRKRTLPGNCACTPLSNSRGARRANSQLKARRMRDRNASWQPPYVLLAHVLLLTSRIFRLRSRVRQVCSLVISHVDRRVFGSIGSHQESVRANDPTASAFLPRPLTAELHFFCFFCPPLSGSRSAARSRCSAPRAAFLAPPQLAGEQIRVFSMAFSRLAVVCALVAG